MFAQSFLLANTFHYLFLLFSSDDTIITLFINRSVVMLLFTYAVYPSISPSKVSTHMSSTILQKQPYFAHFLQSFFGHVFCNPLICDLLSYILYPFSHQNILYRIPSSAYYFLSFIIILSHSLLLCIIFFFTSLH